MNTTRLSSKGQIVIPQAVRQKHGWQPGQDFIVEEADDSVVLRPKPFFAPISVEEVFGCLDYDGPPLSVDDMDAAVQRAARTRWAGDEVA